MCCDLPFLPSVPAWPVLEATRWLGTEAKCRSPQPDGLRSAGSCRHMSIGSSGPYHDSTRRSSAPGASQALVAALVFVTDPALVCARVRFLAPIGGHFDVIAFNHSP